MKVAVFKILQRTQGASEYNYEPSCTEGNQVQPLERILMARAQGIPVDYFNGKYSDVDTDDYFKLDFAEIYEKRLELEEQIASLKEEYHISTVALENARVEKAKKKLEEERKSPSDEEKP